MERMTIRLCAISTTVLFIGFEGEQNHRQFAFDSAPILNEYPDAMPSMVVKPPVGDLYPKHVEKEGGLVLWDVSASDCANDGSGEYQLTFTNGDEIIKTYVGQFMVLNSLYSTGTAPDPIADWMEDAQAALGELEGLTASAEDLPAGSAATAEITDVGGHKNIAIGIPAGQQGDPGEPGEPGDDGFSPVVSVSDITGGHRVSITDATGTKTFDVMNGTDGQDGDPGEDGFSPVVTVTDITGGHQVTITDADGNHTFDVMDGATADDIIDDSAGTGVTNKTWSANKLASEVGTLTSALNDKYTKPQTGIPASDLASGVIPTVPVTDVQVNGTSVLSNGTANIPLAGTSNPGVVKVSSSYGTFMDGMTLGVSKATSDNVKGGTQQSKPIVPYNQHESAFYALAKAAGADMASVSGATVGVYPEAQKSAISQMLNAPVSVSGSTPSITAKPGVRYVCGECSTLTIVVPASGCIDVVFESGSTATVLTVTPPSGVTAIKWANGFDPSSLDANTTYEINILDGEYGVACTWT